MPNGGWDHFSGRTYAFENGNGSDPDYIQKLGAGCELCCFQRPLAVQTWSWSKLKPTPVTVGTAIIVIDPKSNLTSTTTVIHTASIIVSGGAYQPSQWITNGTYYSPSLTAPRTTSYTDLDGTKRTIVYPTQTTHIQSYLNWIGKVPITRDGTTSCLVNDGARSSVPLPTHTPPPVLGVADPADPNGVWWALASDVPTPFLGADEVDAYFAGQLFQSVADSCVAAWPLAPETAVALGSFLLQTSTSYGAVPTSASETTPTASTAVQAPTLPSQGSKTTALVEPIAGEGSASTMASPPKETSPSTISPTVSLALESPTGVEVSSVANTVPAVGSARPADAATPAFTYSPRMSKPTSMMTVANTAEVSIPPPLALGSTQAGAVASTQVTSVQTMPVLGVQSPNNPPDTPQTYVPHTTNLATFTAEISKTAGEVQPAQGSGQTNTKPSPGLPAGMGALIISVLAGGSSHAESTRPASPTNAFQVLTQALQSEEAGQGSSILPSTGAPIPASFTTLPQHSPQGPPDAPVTPSSCTSGFEPSAIPSSQAVDPDTTATSIPTNPPDTVVSTLSRATTTTLITDSILQPHQTPSTSESLPRVTVAPVPTTVAPFTIGLQPLLPGVPAVTVNGTPYSLATASSATEVVVNGQTSMVRTRAGSEPSVGAVVTTSTYKGDADSLKQVSRRRCIEMTMVLLGMVAWQYVL
ncbi:hypothetical protein B0A48_14770 [Cryoendolithus antarcticus]|uniref:Uncharacterized protein n=1 Tax=Cryoendolithus antarcticus TaxID=1507870 RepID=A0A1V8SKG7_9PEZI|nr:hypothetical protein B0A48_14770 [Cryoendolithus antarcticus]